MPEHLPLKWNYQLEEAFDVYLQAKSQFNSSHFCWDIAKILQTCYFVDTWLHKPKITVSTCRKLWYLSAYHKYTSSFTSFLRYYIFKNLTIWLANSILAYNLRIRILQIWVGGEISIWILVFILDYFQEKRPLSMSKYSNYLPSCKKSKKTNDTFLRKMLNWLMDRQTHRQCLFYRTLHRTGAQKCNWNWCSTS